MSLIELPSNNGKVFAVNPHHVSAVAPYSGTLAGRVGLHDMCVVYVRNPGGPTGIYISAWSVTDTLDALNIGRHSDYAAFHAGYTAAQGMGALSPDNAEVTESFRQWAGADTHVVESNV
jgi:hypothetical protein